MSSVADNPKLSPQVRRYLAECGRKGGMISRRALTSDQARAMVAVREARKAERQARGRE